MRYVLDILSLDRFFRWWKKLWDEKIAPYEKTNERPTGSVGEAGHIPSINRIIDNGKQAENKLPSSKEIIELYMLGMELNDLDKEINKSLRKYKMRRRVNPRHGWWLAMGRGRFRGVSYAG